MKKEEAIALLKRVDHEMKYPKTSTSAVISGAHGDLVSALEASLARESELERRLEAIAENERRTAAAVDDPRLSTRGKVPTETLPMQKKRDGHSTV